MRHYCPRCHTPGSGRGATYCPRCQSPRYLCPVEDDRPLAGSVFIGAGYRRPSLVSRVAATLARVLKTSDL